MPRVLGWNAINLYELGLQSDGYYERYENTRVYHRILQKLREISLYLANLHILREVNFWANLDFLKSVILDSFEASEKFDFGEFQFFQNGKKGHKS